MARVSVKFIGAKELEKAFGRMAKKLQSKEAVRVVRDAVEPIVQSVKKEAPFDPGRTKGTHLRDAIEGGVFRKRFGQPLAAFARVDRVKAPHAHLIQGGTVKMKANRFWTRGVRKAAPKANDIVLKGFGDILEKEFKK